MPRIHTQVKIHEVKGPRLPYRPDEAEILENEYAYLDADGILVADGEGIVYWIDTHVTTDAGSCIAYDNTAASGKILSAGYAAKKPHSIPNSWDPPKIYRHGIYADVNNASVEVCYKPIARNLRCMVTVAYAPGTKNLVCKVTVKEAEPGSKDLKCRTTVVYAAGSLNLVSRATVLLKSSKDLAAKTTIRQNSGTDLPAAVTVVFIPASKDLACKLVVRQVSSKSLVCHLYADRTE
jgi:hypothetical protein